jgi:glycosyltransferase involved in cell wall biosynthesis
VASASSRPPVAADKERPPGPAAVRGLGLFVDAAFLRDGERVLCGEELYGFMRFACAVGERFERFALIARETEDAAAAGHELPAGVELIALPDYGSLRRLGGLLRALPATVRRMWRALDGLDAVWVSGVNPLGLVLAALAGLRRRRVVLLIRQDSPRYFRSRLPSGRWAPLLVPLRLLDLCFRLIGRRARTTVVGSEIAEHYRAPRPNVLAMRVTLLERGQLAAAPPDSDWAGTVRLLTVGRIEPEKNPLLAVEALAELNRHGGRAYAWSWAGEGRLTAEMRAAADAAGVGSQLDLPGFVPFGPRLLGLYRGADAFVHVALTEGVPGVIYEAMGSGLPIVATDVGGIRAALGGGAAGLLVPPEDPPALVAAVQRLAEDPGLRHDLAARALALAGEATIESESARVASFISSPGPA